jgi:hypothetical protein
LGQELASFGYLGLLALLGDIFAQLGAALVDVGDKKRQPAKFSGVQPPFLFGFPSQGGSSEGPATLLPFF